MRIESHGRKRARFRKVKKTTATRNENRGNVRSVSELRSKTSEILDQARRSGRPVFVTRRGRSVAVILDLGEYEALAGGEAFSRAVREGDAAARAGDLHPHSRAVEILDSFGKLA